VMPRGSETAIPMVFEPTSNPRIRGRRSVLAASSESEGTAELYVRRGLQELGYDTEMAAEQPQLRGTPTLDAAVLQNNKAAKPHWAFTAVGVATLLAICYWCELVLAVTLVSTLLAFILAPVMDRLVQMRLPRGLAAAIAVLLLLSMLGGIVYYSSNQALSFVQDLSQYTSRIREQVTRFRQTAEALDVSNPEGQRNQSGGFHPGTDWGDILTRGFGSVSQALFLASFVPFLVYFMLTWQHHVRSATVMLFSMPNRNTAYVTLGLISAMIRSFMVGNLLIGLFIGTISTAVFALLHLPFFYFVGFISGFLSLIPYLGFFLALAPPLFVGIGHMNSGDVALIVLTVLGLHLIALNVLYPKFLGNRLQLNPLAVTLALLVWGWLWGGIGLLLAIPITAAMKIIFDHVESLKPYGAWLGE
jgi:predicted PurR-regulated permease PerM